MNGGQREPGLLGDPGQRQLTTGVGQHFQHVKGSAHRLHPAACLGGAARWTVVAFHIVEVSNAGPLVTTTSPPGPCVFSRWS
jgi:hypothetical protein